MIFVNDVCGVDVCHTELLGFGADGEPVVAAGTAMATRHEWPFSLILWGFPGVPTGFRTRNLLFHRQALYR